MPRHEKELNRVYPVGNVSARASVAAAIRGGRGAFTLVELLVVMAIIVILASLIVPAVTPILRGSQLNQATQLIVDQLSIARQVALTKNHSVEVRFYQFGDPEAGESATNPNGGNYRAMQLFEVLDSGLVALGKIQRLPLSIMIDRNEKRTGLNDKLSTLILVAQPSDSAYPAFVTAASQTTTIPGVTSYNSTSFRFLPDGSTNLSSPTSLWFLTLHNITDRGDVQSNFATIQIDAYNGHLRTFRP